ncbi:MAG TPA: dihydrolipoamide acetyltransferase family protein [Candidatus Nanopelagicales bacterium]|nr:dihydrolipoamide acetyltransferase family protein [Candidatus Nanopelagicales bacterium]
MPEVAANVTEALIAAWNVEVGAQFAAGQPVVTVETDKAIVDVEAESSGVLLRALAEPGASVAVGAPIAVLGAVGEPPADLDAFVASLGVVATAPPEAAAIEVPATVATADAAGPAPAAESLAGHDGHRTFASPLARRLAREHGVDLAAVAGSGPGGRIRRADIESHLRSSVSDRAGVPAREVQTPEQQAPGVVPTYADVPNSRMRNAIAARLTESVTTAPHFYVKGSAQVDALLALRAEINALDGVRVSVNDLVVKAVAKAHMLVPAVNVTWNGDSIRHYSSVDVAIAVATDTGLVTPVVRGVERLSVTDLAATTRDLAARAKEKRLQQSELEGGSISVSNLGMYGTEEFSAIINPPHAAILAVGSARPEPVVVDGQLVVATVVHVTLSVDHRPVDGATAAEWMSVFV